jgi:predicted transcriptional regulator
VRKRSWDAITVDMLEATLTPQRKMRIMYKTNLNYHRFKQYFCDLRKKGFIVEAHDYDGGSAYQISERGRTLLAALRKAQELASSE